MVPSADFARVREPRFAIPRAVLRMSGDERTPPPAAPSGAELLGLGALLAAAVVVPLVVGLVVDATAHSSPVGLLVGLLIGITAAAVTTLQRFRRYL
jgi:F0F1-type ATP synthase assembly protein I